MDLSFDCYDVPAVSFNPPSAFEDSISPSDFDCSASDFPNLSLIVESIVNRWILTVLWHFSKELDFCNEKHLKYLGPLFLSC